MLILAEMFCCRNIISYANGTKFQGNINTDFERTVVFRESEI